MKQALTFTPPILSSTESKLNVEAFDASVEAFETNFIFPTVLLS